MKKVSLFLSFILCFLLCGFAKPPQTIYHFFTHSLIADCDLAFSNSNPMRLDYDRDCLTVSEFSGILQGLYERDFVLVDIFDVYQNGQKKNIQIAGKKPMILSFDDINYYIKKIHLGMNDKLILSGDGVLATLRNGVVSYDSEVVTILESFIATHPDFSYNGARGILCLTGFDGILGYRTQSDSSNSGFEQICAKEVVEALKSKGWRFACHSYGHRHMKSISEELFIHDTNKWLAEVSPLLGETDLYVYPYGEWDMGRKQEHLLSNGFKLFFGVGMQPYYKSMSLASGTEKCLFMDRIPLDGRTLRKYPKQLAAYFDVEKIYDKKRPS